MLIIPAIFLENAFGELAFSRHKCQFPAIFQEMLFVKMNHGTFQESRGYMPISPSVRKRIPQFSRGFTKEKLKSALTYLGEIDKRQKTAYISDETELVHFISHVIG